MSRPAPISLSRQAARRGLALVAALALIATVCGLRAVAASAAVSPEMLGVNLRLVTENPNQLGPGDLGSASAAGLGTARVPIDADGNDGMDPDTIMSLAASAHLRVYAELGLPTTEAPAAAAADMAQFVSTFAARYGPGGAFWAANPQLPYLPVERFEIGNEPNMPLQWVADTTHLHWDDPSAYAAVYAASRAALHQVDPSGVAVVGGLGDSASGGVDLPDVERWLSALAPGAVDAVGYHPYVYDVSDDLLESDTAQLRAWMDAHGFAGVALDVNEFGACEVTAATTDNSECQRSQPNAQWGAAVAGYTQWAVCNPQLEVGDVQPFYWGSTYRTDADVWTPLMNGSHALTPLGQDYLGMAQALTSSGCPALAPESMVSPSVTGAAKVGGTLSAAPGFWTGNPAPGLAYQWQRCNGAGQACAAIPGATSATYTVQPADGAATVRVVLTAVNGAGQSAAASAASAVIPTPTATARATTAANTKPGSARASAASLNRPPAAHLRIVRLRRTGRRLDVLVRCLSGCARIRVNATPHGGRARTLRIVARNPKRAQSEFAIRLGRGWWTITVAAVPTRGHRAARLARRVVVR